MLYELWTDKNGKFGVIAKGSQIFEFCDSNLYAKKLIDTRNVSSMSEHYFEVWVSEVLENNPCFDEDGKMIYDELY